MSGPEIRSRWTVGHQTLGLKKETSTTKETLVRSNVKGLKDLMILSKDNTKGSERGVTYRVKLTSLTPGFRVKGNSVTRLKVRYYYCRYYSRL